MPSPKQKNKVSDIQDSPSDKGQELVEKLEERKEEINESLTEIYQDENGNMVDVKSIEKRKKKGFFFWFLLIIIIAALVGAGAGYFYKYYNKKITGEKIELSVATDKKDIVSGQEYSYVVDYHNGEKVEIKNIQIKIALPENFIVTEASPQPAVASSSLNNIWNIDRLLPFASGQIKIKGKLMGMKGAKANAVAEMIYTPKNFSSEFKKSANLEIVILDNGLEISVDSYSSILVGEENKITVGIKAKDLSYIDKLKLDVVLPENSGIEILSSGTTSKDSIIEQSTLRLSEWQINKITKDGLEFTIPFKAKERVNQNEKINLVFSYPQNDKDYRVFEYPIELEIVKSDLNLGLVVNGSRNDQGINFGEALHYSVTYSNKGDSEMKDIVIMAVIEGDYLDWSTLKDSLKGNAKDGMITWTKEEIPELAVLSPGSEASIDFTIQALPQSAINSAKKNYEIKSYAQFTIGNRSAIKTVGDSKSNIIINKINTDLELKESIRYFNEDNIPVGSGPLPPKVGEATTYKVYWSIANNLHEINNLKVEVSLPPYVSWDEKNTSTQGTVTYSQDEKKVVWDIGRLPVIYDEIKAEFSVKIIPGEDDRNKVLVLLPGSNITALDTETNAEIKKESKAKTTKLEDDDIAIGDGRIQ
jgi:hypothetical protein